MSVFVLVALAAVTCPEGQSVTADTAGHCCWGNQVWSNSRAVCVGTPSCPAGQRAEGDRCVADCPEGQSVNADTAGHCCWGNQVWSNSRGVCVGTPSCPQGLAVSGEACVAQVAPPPPPLVAPVEEPQRTPLVATPSPAPAEPIVGPVREASSPPPAVAKETPKPPAREYGVVDVRAHFIVDFASPAMVGGQGELAINTAKGAAGRTGIALGVAIFGHPEDTYDTRSVILLEGSVYGGIRLGNGPLEWLFRIGAGAASVNQFDSNRWLYKMFAGTELLIAFSRRGSGMSVGFDCFFINGFSFVPRIGFVI